MGSTFKRILIANRGEIAIRIARAAQELGIGTVSIATLEEASEMHTRMTDETVWMNTTGVAAYLDGPAIVQAALKTGCDAIHPGYGFLSENAEFSRLVRSAGIHFIGPSDKVLALFGDKSSARFFAASHGVPVPAGTGGATSLEEARNFMNALPEGSAVMIKALSGGGGRGMRRVSTLDELNTAFAICTSEAAKAFGNDALYLEQIVPNARHIEVQIIGDGERAIHLGDRDCSIQRRHQKVLEIAPSPWLSPGLRQRLLDASLHLAAQCQFATIGTFEFLVPLQPDKEGATFYFIEANPRLQVEHTVTEEVTGIDLVSTQIRLAAGESLDNLGLEQSSMMFYPGYAIQLRVLIESMGVSESAPADDGRLAEFDLPAGPGVRVDTHCYPGYKPNRNFDSLLGKLIVTSRSPDFQKVVERGYRAACEFTIAGVENNLDFLRNLLCLAEFRESPTSTEFLNDHSLFLSRYVQTHVLRRKTITSSSISLGRASISSVETHQAPEGQFAVCCDMSAKVVEISVESGQRVMRGQQIAVLEAMKMEHAVTAPSSGWVRSIVCRVGDQKKSGSTILFMERDDAEPMNVLQVDNLERCGPRADLEELRERHAMTLDVARPDAVARRRATGHRTARENLADLCDPGSFREYGSLAVAAQRSTRSFEELQRISPADGFIYGLASINGDLFGPDHSRCFVGMSDYTVFSGTQGFIGHKKLDRLFELTEQHRRPLVLFTDGGGGRAMDTDNFAGVNFANPTFWKLGRLSGLVPLVGVVAGPCFAASAAMLGCCDVTIATRSASIGMGGPVMVEAAGLGRVATSELGPASMHARNGVVDILVADESEAVATAKRYLAYFQGNLTEWSVADQMVLREVVPVKRARSYEVRDVIHCLMDEESVLELRAGFGRGIVTALARIEGRTVGVLANDSHTNGGAIGADEADKMTRFLKLCDTFDIPVVSLCDTPGFMVGVDAEETALVRHVARIFMVGPKLKVPFFTIVLRKAYGLGGMAMGAGCFAGSLFAVAWPTGEFGSMGLEGQARLAYRRELEAITDPVERNHTLRGYVDRLYERNKAVNIAPYLSIDDVIDPAHTRAWLVDGLRSARTRSAGEHKSAVLDAW